MTDTETTEIEGFEENSVNLGNYPIDSVLIRSENRTIYEIVRRINQGKFRLTPDFQRDFIWDENQQSKLIESCLMRIPLPVFYLAEGEEGETIVVDGQQRLTTFSRYLDNEFSLKGLGGDSHQVNGKKFNELPPKLQNRLEDTQLILYLIDSKVPEEARLDIFERVNSGVPLTRQQMRNALYSGPATQWLKEQAQYPIFQELTNFSDKDRKGMRDREFVNRFCAFYLLGEELYPGDNRMDEFLAESLRQMNKMSESALADLANRFQPSMKNNRIVFGEYAFRKPAEGTNRQNPLNVAIFDVFSVYLARYSEQEAKEKSSQIIQVFKRLMADDNFYKAISGGTTTKRRIVNKFKATEKAFAEVMNSC
jgi:hypothetical protein